MGIDSRPLRPASTDRREKPAHIVLDIYTGPKELLSVEAPPEFGKVFESMLQEDVSLPVRGYAYAMDGGGAAVSYKYLPEQDKRAAGA